MADSASSNPVSAIDFLASKVDAAWRILCDRYAGRMSAAEFDHLFARFVLGLTSPAYQDGAPSAHLQICRELLGRKLNPERVHIALHSIPESIAPWVEGAYDAVERQGGSIGLAFAKQERIHEDGPVAVADAGSSIVRTKEELANG
jgi:hypothetical protein